MLDWFNDNLRLSRVEKLSSKVTDIISAIHGTIQKGSKKLFVSCTYFSAVSSHGGPLAGA